MVIMHRGYRKASDRTCSCCPAILPDDQRVLCDRCLHEARRDPWYVTRGMMLVRGGTGSGSPDSETP